MLINVIVVTAVPSGVPVVASFGLTIAVSELHNNVGEFGRRKKQPIKQPTQGRMTKQATTA